MVNGHVRGLLTATQTTRRDWEATPTCHTLIMHRNTSEHSSILSCHSFLTLSSPFPFPYTLNWSFTNFLFPKTIDVFVSSLLYIHKSCMLHALFGDQLCHKLTAYCARHTHTYLQLDLQHSKVPISPSPRYLRAMHNLQQYVANQDSWSFDPLPGLWIHDLHLGYNLLVTNDASLNRWIGALFN